MTIYDVLCNSKEYCHPAHEWVHIGSTFYGAGEEIWQMTVTFQGCGKKFDGKTAELAKACERLHGLNWKKAMWLTSWNCFVSSRYTETGNPMTNSGEFAGAGDGTFWSICIMRR